jgi:hypothetical protein
MSLQVQDVEFNISIGTSDVAVTGVGFQPKVILFMAIGRSESTDAGAGGNTNRMLGWAAATTEGGGTKQNCVATRGEDAVDADTADARHRIHTNACVVAVGSSGAEDGRASLQSFDSDGFTLNIDNQFSINQRVLAICFGGSDITNIETGAFTTPTTGVEPFTQDVTTGFDVSDGQGILFLLGGQHDTDNDFGAYSTLCFGGAVSPSSTFNFLGSRRRNNLTTTLAIRALGRVLCYGIPNGNHSSQSRRVTFNSWITGGFRLQWEQITSSPARVYWLAIKGGKWAILDGNMAATATTVALTGAGFAPLGGLVVSHLSTEDGGGSSSIKSSDLCSLGIFTGATSRRAVAMADSSGQVTSECGTRIEHDAVCVQCDVEGTAGALMDVSSLDSDGVTFTMDDPDNTASFFVTVLAGNASGGGGGGGTGGGHYYRMRRRR